MSEPKVDVSRQLRVKSDSDGNPLSPGSARATNVQLHMSKDYKKEFVSEPLPEAPPSNPHLRPYWLMRILAQTIQNGAHLTPKVFVPRSVWFQTNTKFLALTTKLETCETLNDLLLKLKEIPLDDTDTVTGELESICALLGPMQNALAKVLYYIKEFKEEKEKEKKQLQQLSILGNKFKKVVGIVRGREKLDDASSYILLLLDVFENSQHLEKLYLHYQDHPSALTAFMKLKRVSEFFQQVICAFVIKDLNMLIERYVKLAKASFDKTEGPKAPKAKKKEEKQ